MSKHIARDVAKDRLLAQRHDSPSPQQFKNILENIADRPGHDARLPNFSSRISPEIGKRDRHVQIDAHSPPPAPLGLVSSQLAASFDSSDDGESSHTTDTPNSGRKSFSMTGNSTRPSSFVDRWVRGGDGAASLDLSARERSFSRRRHEQSKEVLRAEYHTIRTQALGQAPCTRDQLERLPPGDLVKLTESVMSLIEGYIRASDDDPLHRSELETAAGSSGHDSRRTSEPLGTARVTFTAGAAKAPGEAPLVDFSYSKAKARRSRPGSADTTVSTASVAAADVGETSTVRKSLDDAGFTTINQYVVVRTVGKGTQGKVKLVQDDAGTSFAMKVVPRALLKGALLSQLETETEGCQSPSKSRIHHEIAVMKKLRHTNVVSLFEVIDDPESKKLYMIMQYAEKGPIVNIDRKTYTCPPLSQDTAARYLVQLVNGVRYLHRKKVVHRDLKPDNILVTSDDTICIADFGVSEILQDDNADIRGRNGTLVFLAPEIIRNDGRDAASGPTADAWSIGVTAFFMVFGFAPFKGTTVDEVTSAILIDPPAFPAHAVNDNEWAPWVEAIGGLLDKDPTTRLTLAQLRHSALLRDRDAKGNIRKKIGFNFGLSASTVFSDEENDFGQTMCVSREEIMHAFTTAEVTSSTVSGRSSPGVGLHHAAPAANDRTSARRLRGPTTSSGNMSPNGGIYSLGRPSQPPLSRLQSHLMYRATTVSQRLPTAASFSNQPRTLAAGDAQPTTLAPARRLLVLSTEDLAGSCNASPMSSGGSFPPNGTLSSLSGTMSGSPARSMSRLARVAQAGATQPGVSESPRATSPTTSPGPSPAPRRLPFLPAQPQSPSRSDASSPSVGVLSTTPTTSPLGSIR